MVVTAAGGRRGEGQRAKKADYVVMKETRFWVVSTNAIYRYKITYLNLT